MAWNSSSQNITSGTNTRKACGMISDDFKTLTAKASGTPLEALFSRVNDQVAMS